MPKNRMWIPVLAVALALPLLLAQKDPRAGAQLQAAITKETVEGDLKGAIAQYQKLARSSDRAVAAKALLRMAQCYEKQGDAEAGKTYERVLREFADQKEAVAEARLHLAAKPSAESGVAARAVLAFDVPGPSGSKDFPSMQDLALTEGNIMSRDGRYAVGLSKGVLLVHDLATGAEYRAAAPASPDELLQNAMISEDGKLVGYTRHSKARAELYLSSADGSNSRLVLAGKEGEGLTMAGISPDGKQVAYIQSNSTSWKLFVADGDGSTPRRLLSSEQPDASAVDKLVNSLVEKFGAQTGAAETKPTAEERQAISQVIGMLAAEIPGQFSWSPDGRHVMVEILAMGKEIDSRLVVISVADGSSRVIPKATSGQFSPDNRFIVFNRPPEALDLTDLAPGGTKIGLNVTPTEGGDEVELYQGNNTMANSPLWSPDGKAVVFTSSRPDQSGSTRSDLYSIRVVDGKPQGSPELVIRDVNVGILTGNRQGFEYGALLAVSPDGSYYYSRKGSADGLYQVDMDPKTATPIGAPKLIAGGKNQGPSWSPDGEWVAYLSVGGTEKNALVIRSAKSGEERHLYPAGIAASDESKQPNRHLQWFPDNHSLLLQYAGGELFRFDTRSGESRRVLENVKIPWIDKNSWWVFAVLAPDGRTIFYETPGDEKRILRRDLNGGPEQEVCRITADRINAFNVSPDGSRLAIIATYGPGAKNEYRTLMTVAASGGEPKEVARPKDLARMLFWSKDGRQLIFNTRPEQQTNDLFSVPVEGGDPRPFGMKLHTVDFPTLSPDGRRMIFMGGGQRNELWVVTARSPASRPQR